MIDKESESFSVSCLQILRFRRVKLFCAFRFFGSPSIETSNRKGNEQQVFVETPKSDTCSN